MHVSTYMTYVIFDYLSLYKRANALVPPTPCLRRGGKGAKRDCQTAVSKPLIDTWPGSLEGWTRWGSSIFFSKNSCWVQKLYCKPFFQRLPSCFGQLQKPLFQRLQMSSFAFLPFFAEAVGFLLSCCLFPKGYSWWHSSQRSTKFAIAATKSRYTGSPLSLAHRCFSQ